MKIIRYNIWHIEINGVPSPKHKYMYPEKWVTMKNFIISGSRSDHR
jgi:hypothetical protein